MCFWWSDHKWSAAKCGLKWGLKSLVFINLWKYMKKNVCDHIAVEKTIQYSSAHSNKWLKDTFWRSAPCMFCCIKTDRWQSKSEFLTLHLYYFELASFLTRLEHGFVHSVVLVHSTSHSCESDVGCDEISRGLNKIQSQGVPGNAC